MLFSSSKLGHIGQILSTGAVWEIGTSAFTPPTANEIETFVHVVIQVVVGIVTVMATVRKMLQKPESVVKMPAVGVVASPTPEPPAPVAPPASWPAPSLAPAPPEPRAQLSPYSAAWVGGVPAGCSAGAGEATTPTAGSFTTDSGFCSILRTVATTVTMPTTT